MSSKSLEEMVEALKCLPGVGQKSAQRMSLYLLERDQAGARRIAEAIMMALDKVRHCQRCRNFSDETLCRICADRAREPQTLCVVETPADVLAIEATSVFRGRYFVLLGRLSPLDGLGPGQLGLEQLESQLAEGDVKEVILATSATVEGDITSQYIADIATRLGVKPSRLARGIPLGGELEFVDGGTLSRALSGRQQIE